MESQNDTTTTEAQSEENKEAEVIEEFELTRERAEELADERGENPYGHHARAVVAVSISDGEIEMSEPYWLQGGQSRMDAPDGHLFDLVIRDDPSETVLHFKQKSGREVQRRRRRRR